MTFAQARPVRKLILLSLQGQIPDLMAFTLKSSCATQREAELLTARELDIEPMVLPGLHRNHRKEKSVVLRKHHLVHHVTMYRESMKSSCATQREAELLTARELDIEPF
jgi:hypothetical protein